MAVRTIGVRADGLSGGVHGRRLNGSPRKMRGIEYDEGAIRLSKESMILERRISEVANNFSLLVGSGSQRTGAVTASDSTRGVTGAGGVEGGHHALPRPHEAVVTAGGRRR